LVYAHENPPEPPHDEPEEPGAPLVANPENSFSEFSDPHFSQTIALSLFE